jgi:hypothetical protein
LIDVPAKKWFDVRELTVDRKYAQSPLHDGDL